MVTSSPIHPARLLDFDSLISGLQAARDERLVVESRDSSGLLLYVYSQKCVYDSGWNQFTLLARGIILDPNARRLVATPFPKFFNLGEGDNTAPDLPFETFEKLDGSLIIIFHHNGRWRAATKGSFQSEQALWAQERLDNAKLHRLVAGTTYLAEAIYPENRIVVFYDQPALVLLGAYAEDGSELSYDQILEVGGLLDWRAAQRHQFTSIGDLIAHAKDLPRSQEGFVLRFTDGQRLKVKGDEYRRIHALISRVTPLAMWEAMAAEDDMQSLRRDLPEEFWDDFDQIVAQIEANAAALVERVSALDKTLGGLSDKDVGLRLQEFDEDLRPFIFSYRKLGPTCFSTGRPRQTLYRQIRPTGNSLPGYIPSYALGRIIEEDG
jgi:RNA ligase